jgi:hypothetical protein
VSRFRTVAKGKGAGDKRQSSIEAIIEADSGFEAADKTVSLFVKTFGFAAASCSVKMLKPKNTKGKAVQA